MASIQSSNGKVGLESMVCLTALFSKQSRNFNCLTLAIFIASVQGGGGGGERGTKSLYFVPEA